MNVFREDLLSETFRNRYDWEAEYIRLNKSGIYLTQIEIDRALYNLIRVYMIRDCENQLRQTGGGDEHFFYELFLEGVIKDARREIAETGQIEYVLQPLVRDPTNRYWALVDVIKTF